MILLADENFPRPTVEALRQAGFDVMWIAEPIARVRSDRDRSALRTCADIYGIGAFDAQLSRFGAIFKKAHSLLASATRRGGRAIKQYQHPLSRRRGDVAARGRQLNIMLLSDAGGPRTRASWLMHTP